MFATLGHGTQHVGQGIARFRAFFAMKGKKLVPNHPFEIVTRGNKVQCLFLTQSSEFEGVGCKDVMVCGKHATESGKNRPG